MNEEKNTAVLLLSCPDRRGLVARIASFVSDSGGNIINLNEYVDVKGNIFFLRVSWDMTEFLYPGELFPEAFRPMAEEFEAAYQIFFLNKRLRLAVFVSKYDHCIRDILWRHTMNEIPVDIPIIISNSEDLRHIGDRYKIPYYVFPITPENKEEQEEKELHLLKETRVDSILLARYMQVLTPNFVANYPNSIINIHHSFLPAFSGGNPYRQAFDRGVKIIGATSHYVTELLDEGPIIEQDIARITHKDTVDDFVRKGRDLERLVLARALRFHAEHRILVHGRKTIVFE
jgi:formyltetrahydrofolate deformylase